MASLYRSKVSRFLQAPEYSLFRQVLLRLTYSLLEEPVPFPMPEQILRLKGGNKSGQHGASGGSGGGGAGQYSIYAGNGGSDGSKGEDARKVGTAIGAVQTGGAGQGTTTRAFGEPNGTLYAGGGGGSWSPSGHTGAVGTNRGYIGYETEREEN